MMGVRKARWSGTYRLKGCCSPAFPPLSLFPLQTALKHALISKLTFDGPQVLSGILNFADGAPIAWTLHMISGSDPQDPGSIESLRREINRLIQEQLDAYQSATLLGMTAHEAKQCDARRESIGKLVEELFHRRAAINDFNV